MIRKTIYCTQTFSKVGRRVVPATRRQHLSAEDAVNAARVLARRKAGVAVFRLEGIPSVDHWEEPQIIALFGAAPMGDP